MIDLTPWHDQSDRSPFESLWFSDGETDEVLSHPQVSPDGISDGMEGLTMTSKYKRVWEHFLSASSLWCHYWIKAWWLLHLSSGPLIRKLPRWACPSCWAMAMWRRKRRPPTMMPPVRHCLSQLYQCGQTKQISEYVERLMFEFWCKRKGGRWSSEGSAEVWQLHFCPQLWLIFVSFCFCRRHIRTDEHCCHGGRGRAGVRWMCLGLSQTRLFSEALASIDGFVLMFIPNFYLFLSVEVLVLAVFCICPFERRLSCWLTWLTHRRSWWSFKHVCAHKLYDVTRCGICREVRACFYHF